MGAAGYDPTMERLSEGAILAIRILFALFPVAFHLVTMMIILRYPISREVHTTIREGIGRHRQGMEARDPITDRSLLPADAQNVDEETGWFLDNFSPQELRGVLAKGTDTLVRRVFITVIRAALVLVGSIGLILWLLSDSLSRSQADQLRQGVAACIMVVAGLAITVMLFHVLRIRPARKMVAEPIDDQIIRAHLGNI